MSEELTTQEQFDYSIVSNEVADRLKQDAVRGRTLLKRTMDDMIELGHILLNGKATLPHGQFIPWAKAEFGISQSTAWRFMQIAQGKEIKSTPQPKSFTVNDLQIQQISEAAESLSQEKSDWREGLDQETIAKLEAIAERIKARSREEAECVIEMGKVYREYQSKFGTPAMFEWAYRTGRATPSDVASYLGIASLYESTPIEDIPNSTIMEICEIGSAVWNREENIEFFREYFKQHFPVPESGSPA